MFSDYASINCPIYSFNIDAIGGEPSTATQDDRIGLTIAKVFSLFFTKINNVAVYVCESLDDRQYARKRKFDFWFWYYNDGSIVKEDGLAVIEGTEIYNSILLHKENKQLNNIILAFRELNERARDK